LSAERFTATVNWGDGTSFDTGTVTGSNGNYTVADAHAYADERATPYPVTVTITLNGAPTVHATAGSSATITDAALHAGAFTLPVTAFKGVSTNASLQFTDDNTAAPTSDFTATINWGDTTTSTATLTGSAGSYSAAGNHTYLSTGPFLVQITVHDTGGSTTSSNQLVTVNNAPIIATGTSITGVEGAAFSRTVANFTDPDSTLTAGTFTATLDWGDGTSLDTGPVSGSNGNYSVAGAHTYADERSTPYPVTVTITLNGAPSVDATAASTATITDAALHAGTLTAPGTAFKGVSTNASLQFTDDNTAAPTSDFTATINWGDTTTTIATLTGSAGNYTAAGSHAYVATGQFPVQITVHDTGGSTTSGNQLITVSNAPITPTGASITTQEGVVLTGTAATFTDPDTTLTAVSFTATIDWGDGTSTGTITGSNGSYTVTGSHTYPEEVGTPYPVTVTIALAAVPAFHSTASSSAGVGDAALHTGSITVPGTAFKGVSINASLQFTDQNTGAPTSDFTATIDWGDGTSSFATVSGSGGSYSAAGSHVYKATGPFIVHITVLDDGGSFTGGAQLVTVNNAPITPTGVSITGVEGTAFTGTVATFTDPDITLTAGSFTASINWGDGTGATTGTVTGSNGSYTINGGHTYADESAPYAIVVTITQTALPTNHATASSTAAIADAALHAGALTVPSPVAVNAPTSISFAFTDDNHGAPSSDFTATIDWGDGTTSTGTVTGSGGSYLVQASHPYTSIGTFAIKVTVVDRGGSTISATGSTGTTVLATLQNLIRAVDATIASDPRKADTDTLKAARASLAASVDPSLWVDGNHLQTKPGFGNKVFVQDHAAVDQLVKLQGDRNTLVPAATLLAWIMTIVTADQTLAQIKISDATAAHGNAKLLAAAATEMTAGAQELSKNHYQAAIDHYNNAWQDAVNSLPGP
jgi:hypothetical protein